MRRGTALPIFFGRGSLIFRPLLGPRIASKTARAFTKLARNSSRCSSEMLRLLSTLGTSGAPFFSGALSLRAAAEAARATSIFFLRALLVLFHCLVDQVEQSTCTRLMRALHQPASVHRLPWAQYLLNASQARACHVNGRLRRQACCAKAVANLLAVFYLPQRRCRAERHLPLDAQAMLQQLVAPYRPLPTKRSLVAGNCVGGGHYQDGDGPRPYK